ncbi:ketodeoxygluconokinase [Lacimicrobium alkaliphilum]|uniref:Ketodeoxygluconokinase n=2 Tax=Lacimicrobium alkaliphilum TaxID=1526571 RepID=A0ABQ1RAI9_9ALTE|nr:ketodeoxygluconokinase [Lacimicrobium alkaliphilum]
MAEFRQNSSGVWQQAFAGDVFNTAVYLKRLSAETGVAFASTTGKDMLSQQLRQYCERVSLDIRWLKSHESRSCGLYFIQTDEQGERQFSYYRERSAARTLVQQFTAADWCAISEQTDWVFYSAITLSILSAEDRKRFIEHLMRLRRQGVKLAFDTNYRASLWESCDSARTWVYCAIDNSDLVFAGTEDMAGILNCPAITAKQLANELAELSVPELVLKAGKEEVGLLVDGDYLTFAVEPVSKVVDTTAAGDSFNAGYLAALLNGQPLSERVQWAKTLAAQVIQYPGAIIPESAMPTMVPNKSDHQHG